MLPNAKFPKRQNKFPKRERSSETLFQTTFPVSTNPYA